MDSYDFIVLGGNIAALICTNELAKEGRNVALVAPSSVPGGHFGAIQLFGFKYDIGLVLLEFDSYREESLPLSQYDPSLLGSVGSYSKRVKDYISEHVPTKPISKLSVASGGILLGDYFTANRLETLVRTLSQSEAENIVAELATSITIGKHHPRDKYFDPDFGILNYQYLSQKNHGKTFHNKYLEPLVQRATGLTSRELSGKFHRLFWAPLFYPETLLKAVEEKTNGFPPTTFHYPVDNGVNSIANIIFNRIKHYTNVDIIDNFKSLRKTSGSWVLDSQVAAPQVVSSLAQNQLASYFGIAQVEMDRSSYALIFLKVAGAMNFDVITNADEDFNFFRVSNPTHMRGSREAGTSHLVLEYNYDFVENRFAGFFKSELFKSELAQFFKKYGVCESLEICQYETRVLENKIAFPTNKNIANSMRLHNKLNTIDGLELMGPSLHLGASSINDQVIQALKYAEARR